MKKKFHRQRSLFLLVVPRLVLSLFAMVGSTARSEDKAVETVGDSRPNILLICVDDLRPELNCYGKEYIHSPHIDALAKQGRLFQHHYVQAPTCGASRYALLTGTYGSSGNGALLQRGGRLMKDPQAAPPSLPAWFRKHGYTTVSVGKVSHHPGGRGGSDWDDDAKPEMPLSWDRHLMPVGPWRHPRGAMHGLANGEIRVRAGEMDVYQAEPGPDAIYPDGLTTDEAMRQMEKLAQDEKPFFLAVGIIRPHLPFGAPAKYMEPYRDVELPPIPHPEKPEGKTTWHGSGEFMKYNRWGRNPNKDAAFATAVRRHYAACVSYADAQVGRLMKQLGELNQDQKTIVVLWGDHGWHLGEHAVWGKHTLFEESLRSPLIVNYPDMPQAGKASKSVVETIDLFPTLCDLARLPKPDFLDGASLLPQIQKPAAPGRPAISYSRARTIRSPTHRLIEHRSGEIELYDHRADAGETKNVAEQQPQVVRALRETLQLRLDKGRFAPDQTNLPAPIPEDAVVLFDDGVKRLVGMSGDALDWPVDDGQLVSTRGQGRTNHAVSTLHFRDADIHVEFQLPEKGSGNSGVYIHGNYELQIFNSSDKAQPTQQDCGAVYGFAAPRVQAARAPGEWQVLDVRYRAPRRDERGQIVVEGAITAWLNGRLVQHLTRVGEPRSKYHPFRYGTTPYLKPIGERLRTTSTGPLFLQDHDNPVRFRNVWVRPLDELAFEYQAKP